MFYAIYYLCCFKFFSHSQRRDSGSGTLASTSDRSSGLKSTSTPSTPQAENHHMESRNSHSTPTESTPSAERLSDVRLDKEVSEDNLLDQETPVVWKLHFSKFSKEVNISISIVCHVANQNIGLSRVGLNIMVINKRSC